MDAISKTSPLRLQLSPPLSSTVCRYAHWSEPWFKTWLQKLNLPTNPTGAQIHRKSWEFCVIGRALEQRGMLQPGKRGICFAAGREFLPSAFAAFGCDILATDRATAGSWAGQHAASRADLFYESIVSREAFDRHVAFRHVDMKELHDLEPDQFDFLWSSCAFEHLGSLGAGFDFVVAAMKLLRPGGVAVHTTEFNLTSDWRTKRWGCTVIYRRRDIEKLERRLQQSGCTLEPVDHDSGDHPFDLDYDTKPFTSGKPHVKLKIRRFVATSILLVIRKTLGGNSRDRNCDSQAR
jgi:hypothetical protein